MKNALNEELCADSDDYEIINVHEDAAQDKYNERTKRPWSEWSDDEDEDWINDTAEEHTFVRVSKQNPGKHSTDQSYWG